MVSGFDVSNWECVWHVLTGIGAFSTWTTVTICIWGHHTYSIARSTTGKLPEGYSLRPLRVRTRGECFKVNTLTRFSCATDRKIGVGVVDNFHNYYYSRRVTTPLPVGHLCTEPLTERTEYRVSQGVDNEWGLSMDIKLRKQHLWCRYSHSTALLYKSQQVYSCLL